MTKRTRTDSAYGGSKPVTIIIIRNPFSAVFTPFVVFPCIPRESKRGTKYRVVERTNIRERRCIAYEDARKRERGRVRENKGERETEIEWEAERERRMCEQQRCISVQRSIHRVEVNARPYSGPRKEREGMEGAIEGRGGRGRETEGKHWAEKMNKHSERPEKGRIECSCTIPLFPFFTSC